MSILAETRHSALHDLADIIAEALAEHYIDPAICEQIGAAAAALFCERWGGSNFYFPTDHQFKLTKRDLEILSKFRGRNHHALAMEYKLTPSAIYKLLKRAQDRKFDRDQGKLDLFPISNKDHNEDVE